MKTKIPTTGKHTSHNAETSHQRPPAAPRAAPSATPPGPAELRSAAGNQAIQQLLRSGTIQAKLTVGSPDDRYEREADHVAEQIASCAHEPAPRSSCEGCTARAVCSHHAGELRLQAKGRGEHKPDVKADAAGKIAALRGGGAPLPSSLRAFFEPRFGQKFDDVRVHGDAHDAGLARSLHARAFTHGRDIVFGDCNHRPDTVEGRRLIAHELTHVVQQSRSRQPSRIQRQEERDPSLRPAIGDCLRVLGPYTAGPIELVGGELVTAQSEPSNMMIQVTLPVPYAHAGEVFAIPVSMLESTEVTREEQTQVQFNVDVLSEADFRQVTGLPAGAIPEGVPMTLDQVQQLATQLPEQSFVGPGLGPAWSMAPWPAFPVPAGATGVQWTQSFFGHLSQFSNVPGAPTIGGYRSYGPIHPYQAAHSTLTGQPWTSPVPGRYFSDWWFRLFSPSSQTLVYREGTPQHADLVARLISEGRYKEPFTFPPSRTPGGACSNCITIPKTQTYGALGGRPVVVTEQGVFDITEFGRLSPEEAFTPEQAGRARTMREWLQRPTVETPSGKIETLSVAEVPPSTVWGARGVTCIRAGGHILLLYGAYKTTARLTEASGTPHFGRVVAQETGSWVGGIVAGALGSAAAGAVACSPTGPGAFVCAAAGFAGGLVLGMTGSYLGANVGDYLYRLFSPKEEPPAGALAFPHPYWIMIDMFLDVGSRDPEGARLIRRAYSGDPQAVGQFMHALAGVPYTPSGYVPW